MDPLRPLRLNDSDVNRYTTRNRSLQRDNLVDDKTESLSRPSGSSYNPTKIQLKDLCAEDKARIGKLVTELSKEKHERKEL